jgi:hypothetical protein
MYTFRIATSKVSDPRARYGARAPEPEEFPAEIVLRDLRRARDDDEVPVILARYAAFRAWLLGTAASDSALVGHARVTAAAHLDAAPQEWPEGPLFRQLLDPPASGPTSWDLLIGIAGAAERAGHVDGALAARLGAWAEAVRVGRLDVAATLAASVAALLGRRGGAEQAAPPSPD